MKHTLCFLIFSCLLSLSCTKNTDAPPGAIDTGQAVKDYIFYSCFAQSLPDSLTKEIDKYDYTRAFYSQEVLSGFTKQLDSVAKQKSNEILRMHGHVETGGRKLIIVNCLDYVRSIEIDQIAEKFRIQQERLYKRHFSE